MKRKIYPKGLKSKEKENYDKMEKIKYSNFSRCKDLADSFLWDASPNGYEYWRKIHERINRDKSK